MLYGFIYYKINLSIILPNVSNSFMASGIKSISYLNKFMSNNWVKSLGSSSLSYKQLFNFSESSAISGAKLYSLSALAVGSFFLSNSTSLVKKKRIRKSKNFEFSSFSKYSSANISVEPITTNLPFPSDWIFLIEMYYFLFIYIYIYIFYNKQHLLVYYMDKTLVRWIKLEMLVIKH